MKTDMKSAGVVPSSLVHERSQKVTQLTAVLHLLFNLMLTDFLRCTFVLWSMAEVPLGFDDGFQIGDIQLIKDVLRNGRLVGQLVGP